MRLLLWLPLIGAFLTNGTLQAQAPALSDQAEIWVITCGPDPNELYAAFGHSAIRIVDPVSGIDDAYNYGVFDFDQPHFYLNFARGFLYYKLGVYHYPDFERYYIRHQRFIHAQKLRLSADQKQRMADFLLWNAQPENRTYRYDYYQDNCASRIRDVLHQQLGAALRWDSTFLQTGHSFRDKTDEYLDPLPWGDLGIDICLGLPIDRPMWAWEYMFLPDYVESFVDHATIREDSLWLPLVAEKKIIFEPASVYIARSALHPWLAGGLFLGLVVGLTLRDFLRRQRTRILDFTLFLLMGLIGLLLLTLWLLTDHTAAAQNLNLLWALPLHAGGAFLAWPRVIKSATRRYFGIAFWGGVLLLVVWAFLPQPLNPFLLPVAAAATLRSYCVWRI